MCGSTVDANQRHAQDKHLTLAFTAPDEPIFIWGDADRLQQTLSNILSNAIKFTPSGGAVTITAQRTGLRARIEVSDTGIGIAEDFLESIFEPVSQADKPATRRYGGLGLGLAIVKQIVTLHGGSVSAKFDRSRVRFEACDVALHPDRAEADNICFTPTLLKRSPAPRTYVVGHLLNVSVLVELLHASGLELLH